jgi:hypothetical protein
MRRRCDELAAFVIFRLQEDTYQAFVWREKHGDTGINLADS